MKNEENLMKKAVSFLLAFMVIMAMVLPSMETRAATMDSVAGVVSTTSKNLNVRSSGSTGSAVVSTLSKGSYVTLLSKSGSWWRVEYGNGKYGYCHADYIQTTGGTAATVKLNSGSLNVRSGPGTGYSRVGSLYHGQVVVVLSASGDWSRILYHGTKTGYVSTRYLSTPQTSGQTYGAVSLNVPDYKQTDSRWATVKIGSSGKTIAQIGCATTAIAMMESYRSGTVIYPDAMAKKLRYTASGNVYWPEDYVVVTGSERYLSGIYATLQKGKPVLFGAKTAAGKQHWVVITGFTGGNTLTPNRFTIHDPGTATRTTLGQFLDDYPVFYKYF